MAQYGMVIDLQRCIGCQTCVMACRVGNNVPVGIFWNRVFTIGGEFIDTASADGKKDYMPMACQHCANPACIKVCPVGATWKDPETGVVRQDYDRCIGCRMCMAACPYTGVRSYNWEEPKYHTAFPTGEINTPPHQKHTVEKCTFCYQRISKGDVPACMRLCPGRARHWGDLEDPNSEVSQLIAKRQWKQLLPEQGTRPSVYYLV